MKRDILEISDDLFAGRTTVEEENPFAPRGELAEVADGVAFTATFANASAFSTEDGLVMVDTGSPYTGKLIYEKIRSWSASRLDTAIFSHGHIDHVFGVGHFEAEAVEKKWKPPRVVAHEAMPARFDRYKLTAGWNLSINRRQFGARGLDWPTEYRYPDETYRDTLDLEVGGVELQLHHCRSETDDQTWTWVPSKKIVCSGDMIIWCTPNAGNPQKVQRYAAEWAAGLREMEALGPDILLPGHGLPVIGRERVSAVLLDTATLLESLHSQTLEMMNRGARLDEIIHTVRPPADLMEKPYLRPVYDDPEFIVRNIWRYYGGWYDGNPANLKPAAEASLASEIVNLAGGVDKLIDRALALADIDELRLAGHLAEMAVLADPENPKAHAARAEIFRERARVESALMSKGIFSDVASESLERAKSLEQN